MPLFGHHDSDRSPKSSPPASTTEPSRDSKDSHRRSHLFGSRNSLKQTSPPRTANTASSVHTNGSTGGSFKSGLLHKDVEDASITAARDRVMSAEAAERDADKALLMAKSAVREARDHVKRLEKEATEQARLAQIKQKQAANLSARARPLGRHEHILSN